MDDIEARINAFNAEQEELHRQWMARRFRGGYVKLILGDEVLRSYGKYPSWSAYDYADKMVNAVREAANAGRGTRSTAYWSKESQEAKKQEIASWLEHAQPGDEKHVEFCFYGGESMTREICSSAPGTGWEPLSYGSVTHRMYVTIYMVVDQEPSEDTHVSEAIIQYYQELKRAASLPIRSKQIPWLKRREEERKQLLKSKEERKA